MPRAPRRRARSSPWQGTIRLAIVFAVLIGLNAYYFLFRRGTSVNDLVRLSANRELAAAVVPAPKAAKKPAPPAIPGAALGKVEPDAESGDDGRVHSGIVTNADTLGGIFKREGVPPRTASDVIASLGKLLDLRTIRAGHSYALRFDAEDHLSGFDYRTTPATSYHVERAATGAKESFRATRDTAPIDVRVTAIGGTIESTLYDAVKHAGENTALVSTFVDLYAWDVNFYTDTHPGDRFRIVVEKLYLGEKFYRYGHVLAAEYEGRTGTFRAFRGPDVAGSAREAAYYDDKGQSIEKSLLKSPLKFVRISSSFDLHRFHPILHTERAHLGVDYAAPVGTPVWATTEGRVTWKGDKGGAGQCVIIAHPGGMESIYMHLSKYAKGLEVGQLVRQKQVIGYVGMTGLATGPHLHFSMKMGGHFVDPLRLKPARAAPVPATEREAFAALVAERSEALGKIDVRLVRREMARGPSPSP